MNHKMILLYEGRYRMWYLCMPRDDERASYVCYAESADGENWERPELGLVEFAGSKANNIVADRRGLRTGVGVPGPGGAAGDALQGDLEPGLLLPAGPGGAPDRGDEVGDPAAAAGAGRGRVHSGRD